MKRELIQTTKSIDLGSFFKEPFPSVRACSRLLFNGNRFHVSHETVELNYRDYDFETKSSLDVSTTIKVKLLSFSRVVLEPSSVFSSEVIF